jgi:hypothetical protein
VLALIVSFRKDKYHPRLIVKQPLVINYNLDLISGATSVFRHLKECFSKINQLGAAALGRLDWRKRSQGWAPD